MVVQKAEKMADVRVGLKAVKMAESLACLMAAAQNTRYKLRAVGAPFESKDKLKARGYRWDAEGRVWSTTLPSQEALQAEAAWLKVEVYGSRSARVVIEALDSLVQFSTRPGMVSELQL